MLISTCVSVSEVMPIFMTRLSDDSGESMTGGRATAGSVAAARDSRSCTICRDVITSVEGSRMSTTEESPSTDLDRMRVEPRHAVERRLERHGDERLDVVGRESRRLGLHFDQRGRELGKDVERRRPQRS